MDIILSLLVQLNTTKIFQYICLEKEKEQEKETKGGWTESEPKICWCKRKNYYNTKYMDWALTKSAISRSLHHSGFGGWGTYNKEKRKTWESIKVSLVNISDIDIKYCTQE